MMYCVLCHCANEGLPQMWNSEASPHVVCRTLGRTASASSHGGSTFVGVALKLAACLALET